MARQLSDAGWKVLATGRRESELEALSTECSGEIVWFACELDTESGRTDLVDWAGSVSDRLDLLLNSAGIQQALQIEPELAVDQVERELAINLVAPVMLTAKLVPLLAAADGGRVVNLSSGLALAPKASAPIYCASKAALSSFSLTSRWQLEHRGIEVVDVITPLVKTPMTEGRNDGAIDSKEFAQRLLKKLDGRKPTDIYIEKTRLLRIVLRIAPKRARRILRDA